MISSASSDFNDDAESVMDTIRVFPTASISSVLFKGFQNESLTDQLFFLFTSYICVGESGFKISLEKALCLGEVLNVNIYIFNRFADKVYGTL